MVFSKPYITFTIASATYIWTNLLVLNIDMKMNLRRLCHIYEWKLVPLKEA